MTLDPTHVWDVDILLNIGRVIGLAHHHGSRTVPQTLKHTIVTLGKGHKDNNNDDDDDDDDNDDDDDGDKMMMMTMIIILIWRHCYPG